MAALTSIVLPKYIMAVTAPIDLPQSAISFIL